MANYGRTHLLFRLVGGFGPVEDAPVEVWSIGLRIDIRATGAVSEEAKLAFLTAVDPAISTFHTKPSMAAGTNCFTSKMTAAYIGTDGRYLGGVDQPTTEFVMFPNRGTTTSEMPFSNSRVVTLRTPVSRGRAHVGRFYYPCQAKVGTNGQLSLDPTQGAADAKTLLLAINAAAEAQWPTSTGVSIFSGTGTGEINPVTRVEVGRAPDTQRRRDNRVKETWSGEDLSATSLVASRSYEPH